VGILHMSGVARGTSQHGILLFVEAVAQKNPGHRLNTLIAR
jgi:hypothetical protein